MTILILDRDGERRAALSAAICSALPGEVVDFAFAAQGDVFGRMGDRQYAAAFLRIDGIPDLEAARQLVRLWPLLPVVLICDSEVYGVEGYHIGVCYCLCYPVGADALLQALARCGLAYR